MPMVRPCASLAPPMTLFESNFTEQLSTVFPAPAPRMLMPAGQVKVPCE